MKKKKKAILPEYNNPPLTEVVMGTQFESMKDYKAPFLWKLWERIGREDFPHIEEVEPIRSPDPVSGHGSELARHWFVHKNNTSLVQFQRDRFLFNWLKDKEKETTYPRYSQLIKNFYKYFDLFEKGLDDVGIQTPELKMLELTYVNVIPFSDFGEDIGDIGKLFNIIKWQSNNHLPSPNGINFHWFFDIERLKSLMKVHIVSAQQNADGLSVLRVELSMKGAAPGTKIKDCRQWFDDARTQLVQSFDDLTTDAMHKKWGVK